MLLPRLIRPAVYIFESPSSTAAAATAFANNASHLPAKFIPVSSSHVNVRYATHQAQGRANGAKDGPGKRLGAKKSGGKCDLSLLSEISEFEEYVMAAEVEGVGR